MGKDASTIKQEIEQTRERMGDTVEALGYKADVPARLKDTMQQRVDAVKGTFNEMVENVTTAVGMAGDSSAEALDHSGSAAGDAFAQTRDRVNATASKVKNGVTDRLQNADVGASAQRAVGTIQENPIGLALAALAIGFLGGSLLPVSDAERKRLKPIGDRFRAQGQAVTADLVQAGKAVIAETTQVAMSSAVESAKSHGNDVVEAAKSRAQQSATNVN